KLVRSVWIGVKQSHNATNLVRSLFDRRELNRRVGSLVECRHDGTQLPGRDSRRRRDLKCVPHSRNNAPRWVYGQGGALHLHYSADLARAVAGEHTDLKVLNDPFVLPVVSVICNGVLCSSRDNTADQGQILKVLQNVPDLLCGFGSPSRHTTQSDIPAQGRRKVLIAHGSPWQLVLPNPISASLGCVANLVTHLRPTSPCEVARGT